MAATSIPATLAIPRRTPGEWINVFALEAKYEILKYLRLHIFSMSTLLFPTMFYVLFGIVLPGGGHASRTETATYLLATMACYGVMGVAMFSFGVGIAMERGQGWLQVKRASPMPLPAYFLAKIVNAMVFAVAISLLLLAVGVAFGGVRMAPLTALKLISVLVLGSIPFSAMGLAIGYFAKPNSAPAMVNLIYLPMSFCSGLWIPIFLLPKVLQNVAQLLPPYHVAQLALNAIKAGPYPNPVGVHVEALIGVTLLFLGLAAYGYWKDEGETYG
jgi:ABC-2 type transport system permease protein